MHLIVGLGNPGDKYAGNRHNIGAMAVDAIARRHGFGPFRSKFQGLIADGNIGGNRVMLLKPETFMNRSGDCVAEAAKFYKIPNSNVTVIYDELDLVPGKVRVKTGGGTGGHNGLRSIDPQIGNDFQRVRLGIGHPGSKHMVSPHVLSDFHKLDHEWLDPLLDAVAENAAMLITGKASNFMNKMALVLVKVDEEFAQAEENKSAAKRSNASSSSAATTSPAKNTKTPAEGPQGPMAAMLKKLLGKSE